MRRLALALICGLAALPGWAAPARISTGEHDGFTRLVVELDEDSAWRLGRSADGYALRIEGPRRDFDLAGAFDLIGRTRLAAIWADEANGDLRIGIACNCHAAPFEFRPGTIVIDLKDGAPPKDSSYEATLNPTAAAPPPPKANGALAFAWADRALGLKNDLDPVAPKGEPATPSPDDHPAPGDAPPPKAEPVPDAFGPAAPAESGPAHDPARPDAGLDPLRAELMREISLGAAQGVVEMRLPPSPEDPAGPEPLRTSPAGQTRVGLGAMEALPQLRVTAPGGDGILLGAEGSECPSDVQLDLAAWGDDRPVWEQISEARNGLTGEFDRPIPEGLRKSIQFHLFIGFGAEARDLMRAYPELDKDEQLWSSLAFALDGQADPAPAFQDFGTCDSAAALWAMLSLPLRDGVTWNLPAVQRSFSALPLHLRQLLGPRLVDILVTRGLEGSVPVIANAIRRAGGQDDRGVRLMEAGVAAEAGDHAAADVLLQGLITDPGPESAQATVALIEGKAARALPVEKDVVTELEALAIEYASAPEGARFRAALVLARALSGDFRQAFAEAPDDAELQADLWRLLSVLGTDDLVLEVAALAPGRSAPTAGRDVAAALAERFLTLGLPAQASAWLTAAPAGDPMLAARVALSLHDGSSALDHLRGLEGEDALALRVKALIMNGEDANAAEELALAGDLTGATSARARARDWAGLQENGEAEWRAAARALAILPAADPSGGPDAGANGPLAEGAALVAQAQATRSALTALLAAVPAP